MRLTLFFRGSLPANGNPKQKQLIRRAFHRQLRLWWSQPPYDHVGQFLTHSPVDGLLRRRPPFDFAPLVLASHDAAVALHVRMLRQGRHGVVRGGGDIDNQLKTLLDALAIPPQDQLPAKDAPGPDESPFCCLLEDDRLITDLRVSVEQLLEPTSQKNEVILLIGFESRTRTRYDAAANFLHG